MSVRGEGQTNVDKWEGIIRLLVLVNRMLGEKEREGNKEKEKGGRRQGEENKMEKINHTKSN